MSSKKSFSILLTSMIIAAVSVTANAVVVTAPGYTVEIYATYTDSAKSYPRHMTFDSNGNLYVTQQDSGTIWRITPSRVASQFASGFDTPYSIAWGGGTPYGDYLYVGAVNIYKVDLNGNKTYFASHTCTGSLAIDRTLTGNYGGYLYLGTGCTDDIDKIDTAGNVLPFSAWPGQTDSGAVYGIAFDPGTAYGGLMFAGTSYDQYYANKSGLFSMSTGGTPTRFSSNLAMVSDASFDKTGLFGGRLFVIGTTSYQLPSGIFSVGVDGIATEFATSSMLNGHGLAFGTDGAMYISEYSSWDGSVIISRIAPAVGELTLTKIDDITDGDCVVPDQKINYTISYEFTGPGDTNVSVIDYLPVGVDYNTSTPPGDYNTVDRTVTWNIGTVPRNGSDTFTLTCLVNYDAEPCSIITNSCRLEGDEMNKVAEVNTPVCFWAQTLELTKVDNITDGDCVVPDSEINYTITYDYRGPGDTNVRVIDSLPAEIDYNSSSPPGDYNAVNKTVTWNIGTVPRDGSGTLTVKGFVNYDAEPCGVFTNSCRIEGDSMADKVAEVNTPVCPWTQIIYVDHNATGVNNGLTWKNAYLDLQNALNRAAAEGHSEIWVAKGTYGPSVSYQGYLTFRLIDGVPVYGHFKGNETSISQRDFNDANNETILNRNGAVWSQYLVTASGLSRNNIIDGFTIKDCTIAAVRIENAYLAISNCVITASGGDGIRAINSAFKVNECVIQNKSIGIYDSNAVFTIDNCIIRNNTSKGMSVDFVNIGSLAKSIISNCLIQNNASGNGIYLNRVPLSSSLVITGCKIFGNATGIYTQNGSCASILDNMIYKNSSMGIILQTAGSTTIRNNTIVGHTGYGIRCMDGGTAPVVNNCIVWGNIDDLYSCTATYSCIEDSDTGAGNIHSDPCFVNADANDFHLRPDSNCIDAGDPNFNDFSDIDIDGECRVMFGKSVVWVDIGADELYWLKADFDRNEIVNFIDYVRWAPAWKTTDPNKSLDSDNDVDIDDLAQFCDNWLLHGPWKQNR